MKNYRQYIYCLLFAVVAISCDDNYEGDASDPGLPLAADTYIKAPGRGQYSMHAFTGEPVAITATLPDGVKSVTIKKTVNLENDETFATGGVLTDNAPGGTNYHFDYVPLEADIDQLVGFTFTAQNADGSEVSSDLTLIVTLSPRDNLPKRKWLFKSKIYVDEDLEDIKPCEQDNYWYFNADGTITVDYGAITAVADCAFDGFSVYDSWELSEDGKTFTIVYHNLFNPAQITTDVYSVKTLTVDKLELEIHLDLSWLDPALTDETYVYQYLAERK